MTRHELRKMTVIKLREEALKYPELSGVHGMKKEELIDALANILGLPPEEEKATKKSLKLKKSYTKDDLKKHIKSYKKERQEALQSKDAKALKIARKRIKRAKRKLRGLAVA